MQRSGTCLEKNGIQNMDGDKLVDTIKHVETPDFFEPTEPIEVAHSSLLRLRVAVR